MKLKKRRKFSRMRGTRTHGWAMKKHKGSGSRGGKGMSGSGKRADQKKSYVIKYLYPYFGKQGFTSRSTERKKEKIMNVGEIEKKYKPGEINLEEYKILGEGELTGKFIIKAKSASQSAIKKVEKAGGKIMLEKEKVKEAKTGKGMKKEEKKLKLKKSERK